MRECDDVVDRRDPRGAGGMARGVAYNLAMRGLLGRHWPVSFLVRTVLEQDADFNTAVGSLVASELMAPCYLTVCGAAPGEGAVISRDREGGARNDVRWLAGAPRPWLVQTNMDCWRDPRGPLLGGHEPKEGGEEEGEDEVEEEEEVEELGGLEVAGEKTAKKVAKGSRGSKRVAAAAPAEAAEGDAWQDICGSVARRAFVDDALASVRAAGRAVALADLWLVASTGPCLADDTVYTVSMEPATGRLVTRTVVTRAMRAAGLARFGAIAAGRAESRSGAKRQSA